MIRNFSLRPIGLAIGVVVLLGLIAVLANPVEGAPSDRAEVPVDYQVAPGPEARADSSDRLGCTKPEAPPDFASYSLGTRVGDHALLTAIRRCDPPIPEEALPVKLASNIPHPNFVSYIYGQCAIDPSSEGGCAPPVELQVWPACERSLADYYAGENHPFPGESLGSLRGVPAWSFEEGERIELYTGESTIVLFADTPKEALSAVSEIQPQSADAPVGEVEDRPATTESDLPAPAQGSLEGTVRCAP